MNYEAHYNTLIERAKNRLLECYTERHHIVPRCMGGSDDADNIVDLTAEEHYVAHQLLVKMHPGNRKLVYAMAAMANMDATGKRINNRLYGWTKRKLSEAQSARRIGKSYEELYGCEEKAEEAKRKKSIAMTGLKRGPQSKEHVAKLSAARKGRKAPNKGQKGIYAWYSNNTEEQYMKIKDAHANWTKGRVYKLKDKV